MVTMRERPLGRLAAGSGEGGNSGQKAVPSQSGPPAKAGRKAGIFQGGGALGGSQWGVTPSIPVLLIISLSVDP